MQSLALRRLTVVLALTTLLACDDPEGGNDTTPALELSTTALLLSEGADAETVMVSLDAAPAEEVTVAVSLTGEGLEVAPTTLHFTPENFDIPQPVAVTAAHDADLLDEVDTLSFAAPGIDTRLVQASTSDDDALAFVVSADRLDMEEGDTTTFELSLSHAPVGDDTVLVQSLNAPLASVTPAQVVFTAANYDTPVTIQVVGVHDADVRTDSTHIRFLATAVGGLDVRVVVTDEDVVEIAVTIPGGPIVIDEGDSSTVLVALTHQPGLPVTVSATPADTVSVAATPAQLTFTPGNWATPVPVKILARQDVDQNGTITEVRFTAPGIDTAQAGVRINDDDNLQVILDDDAIALPNGDSAFVNVSLSAFLLPPTDSLVVTIQSQTPGIVLATPATVTFTAANFTTPVPVKIKRVGNGVGIVRLTAPNYDTNNVVVN
jgi:hypothetical protein